MFRSLLVALLLVPAVADAQGMRPACGGINDTAEFAAAIAKLGAEGGAILLPASIAGPRCAIDSLDIPETVALDNSSGSGLKINTGHTLTTRGPIINPPRKQIFYNVSTGHGAVRFGAGDQVDTVYPQWFGATADGTTDDSEASRAALEATPSPGHLHFPAGTYWLGKATRQARLEIATSGITITGDGMRNSVLKYDSDVRNIDGSFGPGSLFRIGDGQSMLTDFVFEDLTLEDVDVVTRWTGGHNPSAIDAYKVEHVRIERVEAVNIKGNSAFMVFSPSKDGRDLLIRDCLIRGTAAGGYVQGAGINFASFSNLRIENNWIEGVGLGGIGAGACGGCSGISITGNTIDYLGRSPQSAAIIFTGDGDGIVVRNNIVKRFGGGQKAIMVGTEDGGKGYAIRNVVVADNIISATAQGSDRGVVLANNWSRVAITGNQIHATYPIDIEGGPGPVEILAIANNLLDKIGGNVAAIGSGPKAIAPTDAISIHDNVVMGAESPLKLLDLTAQSIWKTRSLRLYNNRLGVSVEDERTGQIDGATSIAAPEGLIVAGNGASAEMKATVYGALVGDVVTIQAAAGLGSGLVARGVVTAADTVTWRLFNDTLAALTVPDRPENGLSIYVTRR